MLRQRLPLSDTAQLTKGCASRSIPRSRRPSATLRRNKGKTLNTGFTIAVGTQTMKGQINLALAPTHEKSMLIGYISRY